MIDLILGAAALAMFYGGFKAGNKFKSIHDMIDAGLKKLK